jgi:hypothetical protein
VIAPAKLMAAIAANPTQITRSENHSRIRVQSSARGRQLTPKRGCP